MEEPLAWWLRAVCRRSFARTYVDASAIERIRGLAAEGSVVFVLRYRSLVDYLLVRTVFLREGLAAPEFANDAVTWWFRPLGAWLRRRIGAWRRGEPVAGSARRLADRQVVGDLVRDGRPLVVFLRSRAGGFLGLLGRRRAIASRRIGAPYLRAILRAAEKGSREVSVVPLAPCLGRGYRRRESRLAAAFYSVREAPNELKKFLTVLLNPADVTLKVGEPIALRRLPKEWPALGEEKKVRRLERELFGYLAREERVVRGPALRPKREVQEIVLQSEDVRDVISRIALERDVMHEKVRKEAVGIFREMAANFNSTYFSIIEFLFYRIWPRLFRGEETTGLDRVADKMREHPIVLVPCHRSHFDYIVLTYLFHINFLSPPHIAAGVNLSFFPMGPLFRGAGAYFIRRSFGDDELYKAVFRQYVSYLIREGYTQEFFIEGGRSRTGKILTPKLGMLGTLVDAFLAGEQKDLYFVPVSISYDRLVESEAYKAELMGDEKTRETFSAMLRARSILRRNHGHVHVSFAEPISLAETLGDDRATLAADDDPDTEERRRRFVLRFGFRLLSEVNRVAVVGAPAIAATVLLSRWWPAIRERDFVPLAKAFVGLARKKGALFTRSLERDPDPWREAIQFLESCGWVARIEDDEESILHVPDDKRINLDFYKNNAIHLFVVPSLVAGAAEDLDAEAVSEEVRWWLDLFRNEFVLPDPRSFEEQVDATRSWLAELAADGPPVRETLAEVLQSFREAYWIVARKVRELPEAGESEKKLGGQIQSSYRANLLLGVCRKPEAKTSVTVKNALGRLAELGYVRFEARGKGGRERWALPGPRFAELRDLERRLRRAVVHPSAPS